MTTFSIPDLSIIIFTDLDGSLLEHNDYSYGPAKPALELIREKKIPLIPVSSKTVLEIQYLFEQLHFSHPIIAENGAIIVIPPNYFNESASTSSIIQPTKTYEEIIATLDLLKSEFAFSGFHNMSDHLVSELTGLSRPEAKRAQDRHASEPIYWEDSDEKFDLFRDRLKEFELTLTRGGRFWHVMGSNSKGEAIKELLKLYKSNGFTPDSTIALGDSENDVSMLNVVNMPVVIKKYDGSYLQTALPDNAIYTDEIGPKGWNQAILKLLTDRN